MPIDDDDDDENPYVYEGLSFDAPPEEWSPDNDNEDEPLMLSSDDPESAAYLSPEFWASLPQYERTEPEEIEYGEPCVNCGSRWPVGQECDHCAFNQMPEDDSPDAVAEREARNLIYDMRIEEIKQGWAEDDAMWSLIGETLYPDTDDDIENRAILEQMRAESHDDDDESPDGDDHGRAESPSPICPNCGGSIEQVTDGWHCGACATVFFTDSCELRHESDDDDDESPDGEHSGNSYSW